MRASTIGEAEGAGFNMNLPLAEQITSEQYLAALDKALKRIRRFKPEYLVVCTGFDTAKGDPTGTWALTVGDFDQLGHAIGRMKLPITAGTAGMMKAKIISTACRVKDWL